MRRSVICRPNLSWRVMASFCSGTRSPELYSSYFLKIKPPDPTTWMRARDENTHFSVESLLSKFGRTGRFHPNPQPRGSTTPPQKHRSCVLGFLSRRPQESEFVSSLRPEPTGCN